MQKSAGLQHIGMAVNQSKIDLLRKKCYKMFIYCPLHLLNMIKKLTDLSEKELQLILNCKKLKNLQVQFESEQIKSLLDKINLQINNHIFGKIPNQKNDQALLATGELLSNPVYILYCICGIFTSITFSLICLVTIPIALSLAFMCFKSTYQEEEKNSKKLYCDLQLMLLKLEVIEEGIKRLNKAKESLPIELPELSSWHDKKKLIRLRDTLSTGIGVSSAAFSSYYCLAIVLGGCSSTLAVSMLSPLVVVITLACCAMAGIYFGYKYYQAGVNKDIVKKGQKQLQQNLEDKTKEFNELLETNKKGSKLLSQKIKTKARKKPKPLLMNRLKENYAITGEPLKTSQFNIIFFPRTLRRPRARYLLSDSTFVCK